MEMSNKKSGSILEFVRELHSWYASVKRDLPWRHTDNPYLLWVSEIILQQTQVVQGLPYFERFISAFPTVDALANAAEDDVLKLWQGLGYYSRARNMHHAANQVMTEFGGRFPQSYDELMTLKGIGDYTASAVSSFSCGEDRACVDGNVIRVICRLFGIEEPYDTGAGKKAIKQLADEILPQGHSAVHNQAMMEFGAMQCTPKNPNCESCVLLSHCMAFDRGLVGELPIKSKRTKVQDVYMYYFVVQYKGQFILQQRSGQGIWKGLFEFPLFEADEAQDEAEVIKFMTDAYGEASDTTVTFSTTYRHLLSHRRIYAQFVIVKLEHAVVVQAPQIMIDSSDFSDYAVPRLIDRFWEDFTA